MPTQDASSSLEAAKSLLAAHRAQADAAAGFLEKATGAAPNSADYHRSLGLALYQLQDYGDSVDELSAAYYISPNAETAARIAMAAWRGNHLDTAEKWAKDAVTKDPEGKLEALTAGTTTTYQGILAQVLLSQGKIAAAQSTAESAIKIEANDVTALTVLSMTHVANGNASHGVATLERAHASATGAVRENIGVASASLGRIANSRLRVPIHVLDLRAILRKVA